MFHTAGAFAVEDKCEEKMPQRQFAQGSLYLLKGVKSVLLFRPVAAEKLSGQWAIVQHFGAMGALHGQGGGVVLCLGHIFCHKERTIMPKAGIIRCMQTEDMCPGTADFKTAASGKLAFEAYGPTEIVGFVSCGGCPGKKAVTRAKMLVDRGAEVVFLASCISKGNPIGMPCPHYEAMAAAIRNKIGEVPLVDWTH